MNTHTQQATAISKWRRSGWTSKAALAAAKALGAVFAVIGFVLIAATR